MHNLMNIIQQLNEMYYWTAYPCLLRLFAIDEGIQKLKKYNIANTSSVTNLVSAILAICQLQCCDPSLKPPRDL
jgi:hypothetical protein